jgi:hypothetical protein
VRHSNAELNVPELRFSRRIQSRATGPSTSNSTIRSSPPRSDGPALFSPFPPFFGNTAHQQLTSLNSNSSIKIQNIQAYPRAQLSAILQNTSQQQTGNGKHATTQRLRRRKPVLKIRLNPPHLNNRQIISSTTGIITNNPNKPTH